MNNVTVNSARNFIPKKLYGMKKRSIKNKMKKIFQKYEDKIEEIAA